MRPDEAFARREFKRFLSAIGFESICDKDHQHMVADLNALIKAMQATARQRGMSEDDIAAVYSASDLLDLYRETLERSH